MSELRKQTGVDKLLILERHGEKIILPIKSYFRLPNLPKGTRDFVASRKVMAEQFRPAFEAYLASKNINPKEIKRLKGLLFENRKYLGRTWHKMQVKEDRFDRRNGTYISILSTGTKRSFYGSCSGGKVIQSVTNLDDLCLDDC
jgi:hypothetical protein